MKTTIIAMCIIGLALQSCAQGEKEIFILPDKFTGHILVIYDQKDGAIDKLEKGNRIYEIPGNGILKTQFSTNPGWKDFPEFYYKRIDSLNKIPFKIDYKSIPIDSVVAYGGSSGAANKDYAANEVVRFIEYYIGNKMQIDSAYQKAEKLDILKLAN
jgi:hypothetical protein